MNRLTSTIIILLLAAGTALAKRPNFEQDRTPSPISLKLQLGVGLNTGSQPGYDYLSEAGVVNGDLLYRLSPHTSLVPVSLSFFFYSGAPASGQTFQGDYQPRLAGGANGYVDPGFYPSPFYDPFYYGYYGQGYYGYRSYSPPNLAWGVSLTPGIRFQTAEGDLFNFYGQAGAGIYQHNQKSSSYYGVGRLSRTSPAVRAEAGVEIIAYHYVNLLVGGGYMWIGDNPAFNGLVQLNLGVRLGF